MLIVERQSRLQQLIAQRGVSDLDTLADEMRVSQSTIRRDIEALEALGLVKRTHGGVMWIGDRAAAPAARPYAFSQRMDYQLAAKRQIARAAKALVKPGETILIDGGTTTFYFAEELLGLPLQIVTNSLPIAELFLNDENVELIITGGLMYPRYGVMLGPTAERVIESFHAQTLFLSVAGINEGWLYNQNLLLVQAEQKMMQQAQQVVLLIDSSKFGQQALSKLCALDRIHAIVTDAALTDEQRQQLDGWPGKLLIATGYEVN